MSVTFIASGQKTFVEKLPEGIRNLKLKAKLYSLEHSREEGFFLLDIGDKYVLPDKTYGNYDEASKRVINTHHSKRGNTGILLTGPKGTGKSLFVKFIANAMIKLNVPVIQFTKPYQGEDIFNFIESIGDCVLVFDEFGKNYSSFNSDGGRELTQVKLLSLLDGLGNSKRLHLFTENNVYSISEYLLNRPGRIHYHFKYSRLGEDVIKEYCRDLSIPEETIKEILALSTKLKVLSFDTISCLINEWKLYGGNLNDHLNILNITLCRDPDNKDVEIISFVKANGTIVPPKTLIAGLKNNYAYIDIIDDKGHNGLFERSETLELEDAVSVNGDIYNFITKANNKIALRIKSV